MRKEQRRREAARLGVLTYEVEVGEVPWLPLGWEQKYDDLAEVTAQPSERPKRREV